ncbi:MULTISPECIES: hypothetical protein [unclassified Crossiella]|uniref:hypothetical protein n=1 Tax=unclassified Crossiella TaxID=2620835 RepID=UPI001FFE6FB7|nr:MULTISPECIES: hypothetical protein [unclassified Crossiella]MCK2243827.1 hypothetical protein [Crossiella sp. S99.2]MCK2257686.1 hypothetical protein [Crossiella sp. S99.1]
MRKIVLGGVLVAASIAGSAAHASPLVSVGDVVVAPHIQTGDIDLLEDVLEYVNIGILGRASSVVSEG